MLTGVTRCPLYLLATVAIALTFCAGCAVRTTADPGAVAERLKAMTGASPRPPGADAAPVPPGVNVADGLTEDESVEIALWNNPVFQVSLAELGFARADLLEAGLLRNPTLSLLFTLGPKQLEAVLRLPIEVLWERPRRVAAARLSADAAAERLVASGLDLVVSVKSSYIDAQLAADRQRLAADAAAVLQRIRDLTESRLRAGDISELEARIGRADAARAEAEIVRTTQDIALADARLRAVLGWAVEGPVATLVTPALAPIASGAECGPFGMLYKDALMARPDVRAAELGVEAAAARLGWERSRTLALTAVVDANGSGSEGFEAGPGVDIGLPLFDRNQAGRARATAELQRATASYAAAQQRVAAEIREAAVLIEQARSSQVAFRDTVARPLEANVASAERAFAEGETSQLFVLENARRLNEARLREREFDADRRRARVRMERAIGRSCEPNRVELTRD